MRVDQIDERDITHETEPVFVIYLYEGDGMTDSDGKVSRSTDAYAIHDATFVEVMHWISQQTTQGDVLWALGVISPGQSRLLWVHGGDPHIREELRTPLERRRIADMERMRADVFGRAHDWGQRE